MFVMSNETCLSVFRDFSLKCVDQFVFHLFISICWFIKQVVYAVFIKQVIYAVFIKQVIYAVFIKQVIYAVFIKQGVYAVFIKQVIDAVFKFPYFARY